MTLNPAELQQLTGLIEARMGALRAELPEDIARAREESWSALAGSVSDASDAAVADLLSDLDQAEVSREVRELEELAEAQRRVAEGLYGRCTACGADIPFERLRAWPGALRCVDCQRVHEKTHAGPRETAV